MPATNSLPAPYLPRAAALADYRLQRIAARTRTSPALARVLLDLALGDGRDAWTPMSAPPILTLTAGAAHG